MKRISRKKQENLATATAWILILLGFASCEAENMDDIEVQEIELQLSLGLSTDGESSPFDGPEQRRAGYASEQGSYRRYSNPDNLALKSNGASTAVAMNTVWGCANIHSAHFLNDGYYGNGSSWISATANSWIKIDLGAVKKFDTVSFGRDRLGYWGDRAPGQFVISTALEDIDSNYTTQFDSSQSAFTGTIAKGSTVRASFDPVTARYVKVEFTNNGVAIDEVEVLNEMSATQSSTYGRAENKQYFLADKAIDGNPDTFSHTYSEKNAWWLLELPAAKEIGQIVIYNRKDCCKERLTNFKVSILNSKDVEVWSDTYYTQSGYPSDRELILLPGSGIIGNKIKIQLLGSGILSLSEVQVNSYCDQGSCVEGQQVFCTIWRETDEFGKPIDNFWAVNVKNYDEGKKLLADAKYIANEEIKEGTCSEISSEMICPLGYIPVCGTVSGFYETKTYDNVCEIERAMMGKAGEDGKANATYEPGACEPACLYYETTDEQGNPRRNMYIQNFMNYDLAKQYLWRSFSFFENEEIFMGNCVNFAKVIPFIEIWRPICTDYPQMNTQYDNFNSFKRAVANGSGEQGRAKAHWEEGECPHCGPNDCAQLMFPMWSKDAFCMAYQDGCKVDENNMCVPNVIGEVDCRDDDPRTYDYCLDHTCYNTR